MFTWELVQHEAIHHGQRSVYAALAGFETPNSGAERTARPVAILMKAATLRLDVRPIPRGSVRVDWRAFAYAVGIETALAIVAVFGGPHGALGALPWMLQLPGILIVFVVGSERLFFVRVVIAVAIQVGVWYLILLRWRRR